MATKAPVSGYPNSLWPCSAAMASALSSESSRTRSSPSSSEQVRNCSALSKQAKASAHVEHPIGQAASAGGAPRSSSAAKDESSGSHALDRTVNAATAESTSSTNSNLFLPTA